MESSDGRLVYWWVDELFAQSSAVKADTDPDSLIRHDLFTAMRNSREWPPDIDATCTIGWYDHSHALRAAEAVGILIAPWQYSPLE